MPDINPAGDKSDAARDELLSAIKQAAGEVVADVVEAQFKKIADERGAKGFNPLGGGNTEITINNIGQGAKSAPVAGGFFAAAIVGLEAEKRGKSGLDAATAYAEKSLRDDVKPAALKALSASKFEDSAFMISDAIRDTWIELLYPNVSVLSLNPQILPMPTGSMTLPQKVSGTTYSFVGEAQEPGISQPKVGAKAMRAKKGGSQVAINMDLVRRGGPRVAAYVQDQMIQDAAIGKDLALLRGLGTEHSPLGLYYRSSTGIPATTTNPTTPAFADVLADLGKVITAQETTNLGFNRAGWTLAPRVKNYMMFQCLTALGLPYFMEELKGGTLMGFPYRSSTQVPVNLGGGANESWIMLANYANVIYGETMNTLLKISDEASYHDAGGNLVSAFGQDQMVIQLLEEYDITVEYQQAVHLLTTVKYGG